MHWMELVAQLGAAAAWPVHAWSSGTLFLFCSVSQAHKVRANLTSEIAVHRSRVVGWTEVLLVISSIQGSAKMYKCI